MDQRNLILLGVYLAALSLLLFLSLRFREKFWAWFGAALFPILLGGVLLYNLIAFPAINQPYFNWAYRGRLQRLPSNQLIDLVETSGTPLRADWIYPFLEDYYLGRTLLIPIPILDSLDLSLERMISQGRLAEVKTIDLDIRLSDRDVGLILDLDHVSIPTMELNQANNITTEVGDVYYLITEVKDPEAPLVLLRYQQELFFLPEDLLAEIEGAL